MTVNREWLGMLWAILLGVAACAPDAAPTFSARRVWAGEIRDLWVTSPSPDGRRLMMRSEAGDLAYRDLESGDVVTIRPAVESADSVGHVRTAVWSPDGTQVAFDLFSSAGSEIRTLEVGGSNERLVVPRDHLYGAKLQGWYDGRLLAHYVPKGDSADYQFVWISLEDGSIETIASFPLNRHVKFSAHSPLSPDGRFIAYEAQNVDEEDADAVVIQADNGTEVLRLAGPDWVQPLGWTPDGRGLLVYSDRQATPGIWHYPMHNGQVLGEPILIRPGRYGPVGASQDALFFAWAGVNRIHVAARDGESGVLTSAPEAVGQEEYSDSPIWSPDGSKLAYVRGRSDVRRTVVVRPASGSEVREFSILVSSVGLWAWQAEDAILGTGVATADGRMHAYELDLDSGRSTDLANLEDALGFDNDFPPPFAFDGRTIFYVREHDAPDPQRNARAKRLAAGDLQTGSDRVVATIASGLQTRRVFLSPDSELLVLLVRETETRSTILMLVPSDGGEPQEVFRTEAPDGISAREAHWGAVEGRFFFATDGAGEVPRRVWRLDHRPEGTTITQLDGFEFQGISEVAVHPAGNRAAFVAEADSAEVWSLEMVRDRPRTR